MVPAPGDPRQSSPAVPASALWVVLACLAFAPALFGAFLDYDDREMVVRNPMLAAGHAADVLAAWGRPTLGLYAPLTYAVYALLAWAGRGGGGELEPMAFHAANLAVHAGGAVVVLRLLGRLGADRRAAFVGALLWAVHPVQAEPVAWVGSLNTVLCGTLALAALLAQTAAWTAVTRGRRATLFAAAAGLTALSLCAKPASVGLPLAALGIDRFVLRRSWRETLAVALAGLAVATPFVLAGAAAQPAVGPVALSVAGRLAVIGHAFAFYLFKAAVPFGFTADYGLAPDVVLAGPWLRLSGLALLPVAAVLVWQRRRRPWLIGAACVFAAGVGPVCGVKDFEFQNVSTVADRYAYFALFGVALAVALGLTGRLRSNRVFAGVLVAAGLLAVIAGATTLKWQDNAALEAATRARNPDGLIPLVLAGDRAIDTGDVAAEEAVCRRYLQHRPDFVPINQTLAYLLLKTGRPAESVDYFRRVLRLKPDATVYNDLAVALMQSGRIDEALTAADTALRLHPSAATARATRGEILRRAGRTAEAAAEFDAALRVDPGNAAALYGLDQLRTPRPTTTTGP